MKYIHDKKISNLVWDLKPANMLLDSDGLVKIIDFGASVRVEESSSLFTGGAKLRGTPAYIAPELYMGIPEDEEVLDPYLCDIYAFGVLMWSLWTGKHPLSHLSTDPKRLYRGVKKRIHSSERGVLLRPIADDKALWDMPPDLKALMVSCWSLRPSERPPSFEVVSKRLKQIDDACEREYAVVREKNEEIEQ